MGNGDSIERRSRRGFALVPTMLAVAGLSVFAVALLTAVLSGKRTVNQQSDDYRLSSAVESVAMLAMEEVWAEYLDSQSGVAGSILTFRAYLDSIGVTDAGPGGQPQATDGTDLISTLALPIGQGGQGNAVMFNEIRIDSVRVVRRDSGDSTQIYLTVSASTNRGGDWVNPELNRAVQQVYTVEPEEFSGFDYALLANNVNCIFCHTNIDSVDRFYNEDSGDYNSFDRIKVGTLESLMLRQDMDGNTSTINDLDTDSYVAGTVYTRGSATDHDGIPIGNWSALDFMGYEFDVDGLIVEDQWGDMSTTAFSPAGSPPVAGENLYLDYPVDMVDQVDGPMPQSFPPPIPDDGSGGSGASNRLVDQGEFDAVADSAEGAITAGIINVTGPTDAIATVQQYASALFTGNTASIQQTVDGNVILSGTLANPITIDGEVAIDGDLIINGYVKGEGTLIVRGNVYVPTDVQYLDGYTYVSGDPPGQPSGPRTFGIAADGTKNALGIAAGGNVLMGDFLQPATLQPSGQWVPPSKYDYINGDDTDDWSFALSEISLFNRSEWARTQPMLPGSPGEANLDPSQWTAVNPDYDANYTPRYYGFGPDDTIPIYNKGNIYFDPANGTWRGDVEVPTYWDPTKLTYVEPTNPTDPYLFDGSGNSIAVVKTLTPTDGWITDYLYKLSVEYFEDVRPYGTPMNVDGLLYTNNAIFTLVSRINTSMLGQLIVNGALVGADLGVLAPGFWDPWDYSPNHSPNSDYAIGLQLNYDERVKDMLNVTNPNQIQLKRTLWNPTANVL